MATIAINDTWVTRPKPNTSAQLRLFCLPYAGGGASTFRSWPDQLPPEVELCSMQLPGRDARHMEAPYTQLSPLVQTLTQALRPYLDLPFAFFGHSMGALISFELARQCCKQLETCPVHLFVSGHRAPQLPDPHPQTHNLPECEFVIQLRRLDGTPEGVLQDRELMELFLPLLRADFTLCETYSYSPDEPLNCPISAFGGTGDGRLSREELSAWRVQTRSSFKLRIFPGKHFFLDSARVPFLRVLARDLAEVSRRLPRSL